MKKLRVCHLFSGVGSPEMALKRLGVDFDIVGYSEIDKFAIQSYKAIHGDQVALGNIEQLEELPSTDLLVYGSPCVSFSVAGKRDGLIDAQGNKTRSGLLLDVERLLDRAKVDGNLPKILLMENVKNLVGKQFKPDFDRWASKLEELGYNNYWKVLNAKDYGIPQNRERVFVVSILKEYDKNGYTFPEPFPLKTRLKDLLEDNVPESYYLSQEAIDKIHNHTFNQARDRIMTGDVCRTFCARDYKDPTCVVEPVIAASRGRNPENPSDRTVGAPTEQRFEINSQGLCNTLTTVQKDNYVVEPKIIQVANYLEGTGNYFKNPNNGRVYSGEGLSPTLNCSEGGNRQPKVITNETEFRVRKLTEREYWRLMGFSDEDIDKVKAAGISKSQMYKQAGNSIVTDVLVNIFKQMRLEDYCE